MFCSSCGSKVAESDSFCSTCGAKNSAINEDIVSAGETHQASGMSSGKKMAIGVVVVILILVIIIVRLNEVTESVPAAAPAPLEPVPAAAPAPPAYTSDFINDMDFLDGTSWELVFELESDIFRTVYTFSGSYISYSEFNLGTGDSYTANYYFSILNNELTFFWGNDYRDTHQIHHDGDNLYLDGHMLTRVE